MKKIGVIFLLIITILSCGKDTGLEDSILYTSLNPTIKISSVSDFTPEQLGDCTVNTPSPEDSTIYQWLDIDNDLEDDFIMDISHLRIVPAEDCDDCIFFEYQITISGANDNNRVSNDLNYSWIPKWYALNDTIQSSDNWHKEIFLSMQGGCDRWIENLRDAYIGFKHNNNYGWIHYAPLPNNGIEIIEYAINQTDNRPIKAGQKN